MCQKTSYHKTSNTQIDKCMREFIKNLRCVLSPDVKILACCCGHNKYPTTIVINYDRYIFDLVSGNSILRTRNFYRKDRQGYYYIPETL